jgi:hypothetical protein
MPRPRDRFLQPGFCGILVGKDLQMVFVADFLAGIDVDQNGYEQDSISIAGCCRFLTLTQCGDRPPR